MPRYRRYFLGLDPGEKGGLAILRDDGEVYWYGKMPVTAGDLWKMVSNFDVTIQMACLERIDPRPTVWFDKKLGQRKSSILRSTCIIYGDYLQLHMAVIAASIDVEVVGPFVWQKGLGIDKRAKSENKSDFKRRLKQFAESLFPSVKVTLALADALLIAEYCRREHINAKDL